MGPAEDRQHAARSCRRSGTATPGLLTPRIGRGGKLAVDLADRVVGLDDDIAYARSYLDPEEAAVDREVQGAVYQRDAVMDRLRQLDPDGVELGRARVRQQTVADGARSAAEDDRGESAGRGGGGFGGAVAGSEW